MSKQQELPVSNLSLITTALDQIRAASWDQQSALTMIRPESSKWALIAAIEDLQSARENLNEAIAKLATAEALMQ